MTKMRPNHLEGGIWWPGPWATPEIGNVKIFHPKSGVGVKNGLFGCHVHLARLPKGWGKAMGNLFALKITSNLLDNLCALFAETELVDPHATAPGWHPRPST